MASSFTTNNDLEKPANGEQSGTWGTTLNRDLDKIDARMGKVLRLNANSAPTLTTSQTAVAQFDSQVIRCSGTLTADRNITFPASKQGRFTVDLQDVVFGANKLILKVTGEAGVTIVSASDRIFGVYSTGVSIRREGATQSPYILNEIRMYAPASTVFTLPFGWYVCNGSNGTPDLRNKFVRGHSAMNATSTGGADTKTVSIRNPKVVGYTVSTTLTSAMIPKHYHHIASPDNIPRVEPSNLTANTAVAATGSGSSNPEYSLTAATTQTSANVGKSGKNVGGGSTPHRHAVSINVSIKQGNISDVKPAYYSLVFIMYRGV